MLLVMFVVTLFMVSLFFTQKNNLKIIFLDVGQGDATLIKTPLGKNILIDTGAKNNLGTKISPYIHPSRRSIDLLILTHPDLDHIGGSLSILKQYDVKNVLHSGLLAGVPLYSAIADEVSYQNISVYEASAGQRVYIEPNVYIDIYSPHENIESFDANEYSIISHIHYGKNSLFITGDATKLNESDLVEVYGNSLGADILKIGHHGSQTSTLSSFVEAVNPQYGVISAGCDNRFGHPHAKVLTTLFQNNVNLLETCSEGDIVFESNGRQIILK